MIARDMAESVDVAHTAEITIALAGQPNCGKSTIFNAVAGFTVDTGNFPGTSVTFTETIVRFEGRRIRLIDLPGTYSISSHDLAEKTAREAVLLLRSEGDVSQASTIESRIRLYHDRQPFRMGPGAER